MWRGKWAAVDKTDIPKNVLDSLEKCFKEVFEKMHTLLGIFAVLPVTVAQDERCFSILRRLKAYLRNSISEDRLIGLELLKIYSDVDVSA